MLRTVFVCLGSIGPAFGAQAQTTSKCVSDRLLDRVEGYVAEPNRSMAYIGRWTRVLNTFYGRPDGMSGT